MKSVTKPSRKIALLIISFFFLSTTLFAASSTGGERVVEKARASVKKASPDDWKTLADAAKICIDKKVNLKEASEWIQQSLEIKKTQYNTEIMGDYYYTNNLPEKAVKWYMKSMMLGKESSRNFDPAILQAKMYDLRRQ